jgi:uncharacterized protein YndB with AHSA1/START domain
MSHEHVSPRAGESAPFHFENRWSVDARPEAVWAVLEKVEDWPQWWPGLSQAHRLDEMCAGSRDEPVQSGDRAHICVRNPIGMALRFDIEAHQVDAPNLIDFCAHGDLRGQGRWTLTDRGHFTEIDSLWCVTTTRPGIRLLRPWAGIMHAIVMKSGQRGLRARLATPPQP